MEKEILRMQIRLFRLACQRWHQSSVECANLFDRYDIDGYIKQLYEIFHVQGDEANLDEIEGYLNGMGVQV